MFKIFRPAYTLMWYVQREFFVSFALTLLAMTIFWLLLVAFQMGAELDNFGVGYAQVLMLAPFILPRALTLALPPATMIATIMVFGRLSAESEILAAQAGGAALRRYVWPLLFCSVVISICSLWLQDTGVRWGNDTIRTSVLQLNKPESFIKTLDKPGGSMSIHPDANKFTRINMLPKITGNDGKEMRPIQIVDFLNSKIMQTVLADDHQFNVAGGDPKNTADHALSIFLANVQTYGDQFNTADEIALRIQLPDIGALIPIGNTRGQKSWRENLDDARKIAHDEHRRWKFMLRRASDYGALAATGSPLDAPAPALISNGWNDTKLHMESIVGQGGATDRMRQDTIEFHRKIALSTLPISMIFLGIGLGLLVNKSNRMIGFLLGLSLYALLYYPLTIVAKTLSSSGNWDKMAKFCPPQYLPNILFLLGGYFLWRMYEHGFMIHMPAFLRRTRSEDPDGPGFFSSVMDLAYRVAWQAPVGFFGIIARLPVSIFRRTTDRYIGTTFLAPLLVVILSIAGLVTAFDLIEHLTEIIDGIRHSTEPMGSLPIRTQAEALRDVFAFYGIQAIDYSLDLVPFEVLIAGMMCAMVLVRNQEHLILKSSGVRLQRALRPAILFAFLACASVTVVREMWMPELMLHRDFLKPQVYHRNSQPSSLALYTLDENKQPLLFEMGSYNFATKQGRDMHVYLLGEQKNRRIPQLVADVVKWNAGREGWELFTDPAVQEQKLLEQAAGPFGGKDKEKDKEKDAKKNKGPETASKDLKPGGQRIEDDNLDLKATYTNPGAMPSIAKHKTRVDFWKGPVDPKYIDNDRLGAKVMRLNELKKLSEFKPELMVDWYRRIGEFAMGFLLLWLALPLMLSDSAGSAVTSIAYSTLIAAFYYGFCEAAKKLGVDGTVITLFTHSLKVPVWAPLIPHCIFFVIGFIQFYWRMET